MQKSKAKVLIVDDEGDLSELLEIALNSDYNIETALDGIAALARLKEFVPDLLVTNTYLSNANGFNIVEEVRKVSQVPILVISGTQLRRKTSYFQEKNIAGVLVKPFTLKELRSHIQAALRA